MKNRHVLIILLLSFNFFLSFAQFENFNIGIYTSDFDNNTYYGQPNDTDPLIGNDIKYLTSIKDKNFNLVLILSHLFYTNGINTPQYVNSSPSKSFLDRCNDLQLKVLLQCPDVSHKSYNSVNSLASINYYGNHPALWGIHISDEPNINYFSDIKKYTTDVKNYNSKIVPFTNLFPNYATRDQLFKDGNNSYPTYFEFSENYVQRFINEAQPTLLSFDHYPINDVPSSDNRYFQDLDIFSKKSVENNIPFYLVIQVGKGKIWCGSYGNTVNKTLTLPEFYYQIFSGLSYGTKGILYFIRDSYVHIDFPDTYDCDYNLWDSKVNEDIKINLSALHKKIIDNSKVLMSLTLKSIYHYSDNPQYSVKSTLNPNMNELIPESSLWYNFSNDSIAQTFFNTNAPFTVINGNLNTIAISFLKNPSNQKLFWIFNKDIGSSIDLTINMKNSVVLHDVLNNLFSTNSQFQTIHLDAGEAKLFQIVDTFLGTNNLSSIVFNGMNNDFFSGIISLNSVSFENSSKVLLRANQIFIREMTNIKEGSNVNIKAIENFYNNPNFVKDNIEQKIRTNKIDNNYNGLTIFPNPSNGIVFIETMNNDNFLKKIIVYNSKGSIVFSRDIIINNKTLFDLTKLPKGVYFVNIISKETNSTHKLILR